MIICRGTNDTHTDKYLPHYSGISSHSKELVHTKRIPHANQCYRNAMNRTTTTTKGSARSMIFDRTYVERLRLRKGSVST